MAATRRLRAPRLCPPGPTTGSPPTPAMPTTTTPPTAAPPSRPASGTAGGSGTDKGAFGGLFGAKPAGSVSWKLYDNSKCEGPPVASDGPVTVTGNGGYPTPSGASPVPAGTFYWVAVYSGDANNK